MAPKVLGDLSATRALREPNVRWYVIGNGVSSTGTWAQVVSLNWLIIRLGGGGLELGIANALHYLPLLVLSPWAGVLADRIDRRRILHWSYAGAAVVATALGVTASTGTITIGLIYLLTLLSGGLEGVSNPAKHAFFSELVSQKDLTSALAMNNALSTGARAAGPALATALIPTLGVASSFFVDAGSYIVLIVALLVIDSSRLIPAEHVERKPGQVREGLRYVGSTPALLAPLLLLAIISAFGIQSPVLLPVLTEGAFHAGASVYAALATVSGVGTVIGALGVARYQRQAPGLLTRVAAVMGIGLVLTAVAPSEWFAGPTLLLAAMAGAGFVTLAYATLQIASLPMMRGRVMALFTMAFVGATAVGAPVVGAVVELAGPRIGYLSSGCVLIVAALIATGATRRVRSPHGGSLAGHSS